MRGQKEIQMTMAKATEADMEAAMLLCGILGDIDVGVYPRGLDGKFAHDEDEDFDPDEYAHLRAFYDRVQTLMARQPGCLNRVVWGMDCVLKNGVFKKESDCLIWADDLAHVVARRATSGSEELLGRIDAMLAGHGVSEWKVCVNEHLQAMLRDPDKMETNAPLEFHVLSRQLARLAESHPDRVQSVRGPDRREWILCAKKEVATPRS